jgi:nitrate reductase gamma subunit
MTKRFYRLLAILIAGVCAAAMLPGAAEAYMGPGSGLAAIGALLSLIGAAVMALVGFIWFPIRRLFKRKSRPASKPDESSAPAQQ